MELGKANHDVAAARNVRVGGDRECPERAELVRG
jgi:hypothetical protein